MGPGGIVSYVATQDLLIITDFNSLLVLKPASMYIKGHKLRAVMEYTQKRRELPGAHILDPDIDYAGEDIRYRSGLSLQSLYVLDLVALADAQASAGLEFRRLLLEQYRTDQIVALEDSAHNCTQVGQTYYNSLVKNWHIRTYSGVFDQFKEPTNSWRSMPVNSKGVFFTADSTYYGLIMPHAKNNSFSIEDRNSD